MGSEMCIRDSHVPAEEAGDVLEEDPGDRAAREESKDMRAHKPVCFPSRRPGRVKFDVDTSCSRVWELI